MELSLLMDALQRAETDKGSEPPTTRSDSSDTSLALETVEVDADTSPANEPQPAPADPAPDDSGQLPAPDARTVTEVTFRSTRPTLRIMMSLLAGALVICSSVAGYYLWQQSSSTAGTATLKVSPLASLPALPALASTTAEKPHPAPPPVDATFDHKQSARILPGGKTESASSDTTAVPQEQTSAGIEIHRTRRSRSIDPMLLEAYTAYKNENYLQAGQLYAKVLRRQPHNRDALLGIAGISLLTGDSDTARRYYEKLLNISPGDSTARVALQSLQAGTDPLQQSSRLRHLLESNRDNAHLHFALANRYVQLDEWKKAQQAFFDAVRIDPDNPEYNYNLAISLDQLGMTSEALIYYRRAQDLARHSATLFDHKQLSRRIHDLQQLEDQRS